jgi:type III restriction enzyme
MATFEPKIYQQQVLESIGTYFKNCHQYSSASTAFTVTTEKLWGAGMPYQSLKGFPSNMPFFCLRVPTGGGKTWLAAKSIALVNTHLLRTDHSVILWLVPSTPIREQTLKALKNLQHPYHAALREAGPITIMDLDEAKNVTRATLDTATTIIVATRQAFQVEDAESRKVYDTSGTLMHHFDNLDPELWKDLLSIGEGKEKVTPYSLANVLRLRHPFVIVDEAHNSRTELGFDMLSRFSPSGIMELTATPDLVRTPSNVLHSVCAAELKAEEMIKLPIVLEVEPLWKQCLADALARRDALQALADIERRSGGSYLRPIILLQGEPRRSGVETIDVERVKRELKESHHIPEEEIIVATGEERGLEKIQEKYPQGILEPACPVKYVITQKALAEGWDCPFAYILVSMASIASSTAVEQLLGRILRQPGANHRKAKELNQSYAFVVSSNLSDTALKLQDRLVTGAGFERREVKDFVKTIQGQQSLLGQDHETLPRVAQPVTVFLMQRPKMEWLSPAVKEKVTWDDEVQKLTLTHTLTEKEAEELQVSAHTAFDSDAIRRAAEKQLASILDIRRPPAELGKPFRIPQLVLQVRDTLRLFDDTELLEYPWDLSTLDAKPAPEELNVLEGKLKASGIGEIDVSDQSGKVEVRFLEGITRDLGLLSPPEHYNEVELAKCLCQKIPDPTLDHSKKNGFILAWVSKLLELPGWDLGRANLMKSFIRDLLETRIRNNRQKAVDLAFQQVFFEGLTPSRVSVGDLNHPGLVFHFRSEVYSPPREYDGRFGNYVFQHHYYRRVGDFDSREEYACACHLDQLASKGEIEFWLRNLVRREGCSFFLQKADGRFYPDFLCQLPGDGTEPGPILVVEYKGADRWKDAKEDRDIGNLWASLSNGRCRFVMVKDKNWASIDAQI